MDYKVMTSNGKWYVHK